MRLLTAPGLSGVAVVAFGNHERAAVTAVLRTPAGRPFAFATPPRPQLASLQLDGEVLDEVLAVDRGELGIELHLHGSPAAVAALRSAFRGALPGDEEPADATTPADRLLRAALSVEQLDLALEQRGEDLDGLLRHLAGLGGAQRAAAVAAVSERSRVARAHVEFERVVLVGAQNAGKSTLFNQLLLRERVLTGPLPGLTRDPVAERTALAGYPYELIDTAGEGAAASEVDARAVAVGRGLRAGAIQILVIDAALGPSAADLALAAAAGRRLVVANKVDLLAGGSAESADSPAQSARSPWPDELACDLRLSAATAEPAALRDQLGAALRALRALPPAGPVHGPAALDREQWAALTALQ